MGIDPLATEFYRSRSYNVGGYSLASWILTTATHPYVREKTYRISVKSTSSGADMIL